MNQCSRRIFHVHINFQVCQVWRDIILRRTFWKIVSERNGIDWTSIPNHIKENERSWIVFYAACKNRIFLRNFILNHSGHRKYIIFLGIFVATFNDYILLFQFSSTIGRNFKTMETESLLSHLPWASIRYRRTRDMSVRLTVPLSIHTTGVFCNRKWI